MILVEECALRLDEPVDRLLRELADRWVLREPNSAVTRHHGRRLSGHRARRAHYYYADDPVAQELLDGGGRDAQADRPSDATLSSRAMTDTRCIRPLSLLLSVRYR
jgi:hypothetical protein